MDEAQPRLLRDTFCRPTPAILSSEGVGLPAHPKTPRPQSLGLPRVDGHAVRVRRRRRRRAGLHGRCGHGVPVPGSDAAFNAGVARCMTQSVRCSEEHASATLQALVEACAGHRGTGTLELVAVGFIAPLRGDCVRGNLACQRMTQHVASLGTFIVLKGPGVSMSDEVLAIESASLIQEFHCSVRMPPFPGFSRREPRNDSSGRQ